MRTCVPRKSGVWRSCAGVFSLPSHPPVAGRRPLHLVQNASVVVCGTLYLSQHTPIRHHSRTHLLPRLGSRRRWRHGRHAWIRERSWRRLISRPHKSLRGTIRSAAVGNAAAGGLWFVLGRAGPVIRLLQSLLEWPVRSQLTIIPHPVLTDSASSRSFPATYAPA